MPKDKDPLTKTNSGFKFPFLKSSSTVSTSGKSAMPFSNTNEMTIVDMSPSSSPIPKTQIVRLANSSANLSKKPNPSSTEGDKAKKVQAQVDEVITIMQSNIDKTVQRGEKLDQLKNKTDQLAEGSMKFKKTATAIKQKT